MTLEGPEVITGAANTGLYFVDDEKPPGCPDALGSASDIAIRHGHDTAIALNRFDYDTGEASTGSRLDAAFDIVEVGCYAFAVGTAILVGFCHEGNPPGQSDCMSKTSNSGNALGAESGAVIAVAKRQQIMVAGMGARHHQCQIDCFGAAVGEMNHPVLALGHSRHQLLRILCRHRVIKHRRTVGELSDLFLHRAHYLRVGMSDRNAHIHAKQINVFVTRFVPQVLTAAMMEDQRCFVRHELALRSRIKPVAALDDGVCVPVSADRLLSWRKIVVHVSRPPCRSNSASTIYWRAENQPSTN